MSITREKIAAAFHEEWKLRLMTPRWPANRDEVRRDVLEKLFAPFAWPGAYTVVFYTDDGDELCTDCAKREVLENRGVVSKSIFWEGEPVNCADCGTLLESAYGVPETSSDTPGSTEGKGA